MQLVNDSKIMDTSLVAKTYYKVHEVTIRNTNTIIKQ